jgi:alpha-amylase/alpha-mannosidase (GH57 family)
MEGGQVELTTTPFFHPILPLLWNKKSAHQAMHGCPLPRHLDPYPEDVDLHLERAVAYHKELFGREPVGLWPSEGSVSQEILPSIAKVGIEWIATDEEILAESTDGWVSRDSHGHIRHPEMLFRPWRVGEGDAQLQIIFRDHAMSDLIGFHYQRSNPAHAAADLLNRVESIRQAVGPHGGGRPALVPIILDGENCWEYYPDGGVEFLRALYQSAAAHKSIEAVRVSEYLREFPATDRAGHLFAGSWISHNFAIWIGHEEVNTAWDCLHQTREFLKQAQKSPGRDPEALRRAWDEIYIAEGSDWFWWFGDDHSSAQDSLFDQLFRKHLQNVYTLLEEPCPSVLLHPITRAERAALHTQPTGFLSVKINGRHTYFEWISAGCYVSGSERGTMTLVSEGLIREIYFGFDVDQFFVRVDTARHAAADLRDVESVHVKFLEPAATEVRVTGFGDRNVQAKLYRKGQAVVGTQIEAAIDEIFEMGIPWADLGVETDDPIHFYVETIIDGQSTDRAPREGSLELAVPSQDFERIMWQV